ncbi:RNA-directed DNA polymerase, eukaryota, reverse transcriptase zinc-binding domain protein [Tanacetum coccineum]
MGCLNNSFEVTRKEASVFAKLAKHCNRTRSIRGELRCSGGRSSFRLLDGDDILMPLKNRLRAGGGGGVCMPSTRLLYKTNLPPQGGNWSWRVPPRDRAIDELSSLISLIGNLSLNSNGTDKWIWLPTCNNLVRRGVNISSNFCPLCDNAIEEIEHSIINCPRAIAVWRKTPGYSRLNKVLHGVVFVTVWALWKWSYGFLRGSNLISLTESSKPFDLFQGPRCLILLVRFYLVPFF